MATGSEMSVDPGGRVGPARALLVVGVPRSGTTVVGAYLASSPEVLDLGEYGGFHVAHAVVPSVIGRMPGPLRDVYLEDLCNHARDFARDAADIAGGLPWYCDATPWNLRAAASIAKQLPDAVFVLMLRHYAGAVQSLRRSWSAGFPWAGATFEEGARLWADMYRAVEQLPPERTVVVSFDMLAVQPESVLTRLEADVASLGVPVSGLDRRSLTVSHANATGPRPTIAVEDSGGISLRPIPSFDPVSWSGDIDASVWPAVRETHMFLKQRFGDTYISPPAPSRLMRHDEVRGLVPYELEGW